MQDWFDSDFNINWEMLENRMLERVSFDEVSSNETDFGKEYKELIERELNNDN